MFIIIISRTLAGTNTSTGTVLVSDIGLGGFLVGINAEEVVSGTRQGRIDYAIVYEDNTYTLLPIGTLGPV